MGASSGPPMSLGIPSERLTPRCRPTALTGRGLNSNVMQRKTSLAERNKYGLSRTVPGQIQREIRQRCGFGCVICGLSLYDYEHFDPDFKDAKEHNPSGMTLLCMQCNQKRKRGILSVESVRRANQNPRCLSQGFANEAFDFGTEPIEIIFAGVTFKNCDHLIVVSGIPILSVKSPEHEHEPFLLSGRFSDDTGAATLKIVENVWSVGADNWDVECKGPRITIRKGPGDIVLVLKSEPPERLIIERLNMEFEGIYFRGNKDVLEVSGNGIHWGRWQGCGMENCHIGMSFN